MSCAGEKFETSCPHCGRRFQVARGSEGKHARCPCGSTFTIAPPPGTPAGELAARPPVVATVVAPARPPVRAATDCHQHPGVPATAACSVCRRLICTTCDVAQPDGSHLCTACAVARLNTSPGNPFVSAVAVAAPGNPFASTVAVAAPGVQCAAHPEVPAVARCGACRTPVCATCDFQFPGGLHFCPACATNPKKSLSSTRKTTVTLSLMAAAWVTFMLFLAFTGALAEVANDETGATMLGMAIMIPGLIGIALAFASLDRRAGNTPVVWVTVIWNSITLGAWLLLIIIGLTMG